MFSKKPHVDIKKTITKIADQKKDSPSRLKHLRVLLDYVEHNEAKSFFEHHYSQIYYIFFDTLCSIEAGLKQKALQKQAREDLELVLFVLEKIFVLLPELIKRKWQFHSIGVVMRKLLHPLNSIKYRTEGMRLFLLWYQILGDSGAGDLQPIYEALVPGIVPLHSGSIVFANSYEQTPQLPTQQQSTSTSYFYDTQSAAAGEGPIFSAASVQPIELEPLVPMMPGETNIKDITAYYLQCMMDFMLSQVTKIYWREKRDAMQLRCFQFLFEQFRRTYIRNVFHDLDENYSIYVDTFELPKFYHTEPETDPYTAAIKESQATAKAAVIRWFAKYLCNEVEAVQRRGASNSVDGQRSVVEHLSGEWHEPTRLELEIVRSTFNASRSNVNLVHELFRQAFLLPFTQSPTMRRVVSVYKDWINKNIDEVPSFMLEPEGANDGTIRAGQSRVLRAFITNAANIFLKNIPQEKLLEEQVDMCKRILNIYRYMVMKVDMDKETWEQMLLVMLRISALVLSEMVPDRKEDTLGGRLAPAFFQTLIVTWIRANLNVCIDLKLWEHFQTTMTMLTEWDELVKEWAKTMDTITRVMCRMVYNINLYDLPLERVGDKRRRKMTQRPANAPVDNRTAPVNETTDGHMQSRMASSRKRSNSGTDSYSHKSSRSRNVKVTRSSSDSRLLIETWRNKRREQLIALRIVPESSKLSKSLDCVGHRSDTPLFSDSSASHSRSPSPTPSSAIDTGSLKDSPLNLDGASLNSNSSVSTTKCVINGGTFRGWASDSSVTLWRRFLGILGDINQLRNPVIHGQVLECLAKIVEDLLKVRDNLGVDPSSPAPLLLPPINYFSPWLFKTLTLGPEFKRGKLIAYKALCLIALRRHDVPPFPDFLCHFYRSLHTGLCSKERDMDVISVIIKYCGSKFFPMGLPGSTCMLIHFLDAADAVVVSENKQLPRVEALSMLGALIGLGALYESIPENMLSLSSSKDRRKDTKEHILNLLIRSSRKESTGLGRALAINCLGIFMYQELSNKNSHPRLKEVTDVLVTATQPTYKMLSRIACDMLRLQCDHSLYLLDNHPDIPRKIIEGLAASLIAHVMKARELDNAYKEYKDSILTIMLCLGEWCMSVPHEFLTSRSSFVNDNSDSLLMTVIRVLNSIVADKEPDLAAEIRNVANPTSPGGESIDMDYTNFTDDSGIAANSPNRRPFVDIRGAEDRSADAGVIKVAAKMCLGYLYNHLGHFPRQYLGAARLNAYINENDDNLHIARNIDEPNEELNAEIFNAPNVLFFVINKSSILSFTEIMYNNENARDNQSNSDTRKVRIIMRDLIGKFAWDCLQIVPSKNDDNLNMDRIGTLAGKDYQKMHHHHLDDEYENDTPNEPQEDMLDTVLKYISNTSPECISNKRAGIPSLANANFARAEENMIALLLNQHYQEMNFMEQHSDVQRKDNVILRNGGNEFSDFRAASRGFIGNDILVASHFQNCRQLLDQLGFLSWEKRTKVEHLSKSEKVLRELRNLDKQNCRETHKIAVIYVAEGQEDKNSILLNSVGSKAFETFVAGLGWEVDLQTHLGFRGGLQKNRSTGRSAPYYATTFVEVLFHVSTRITASLEDSDSLTKKLRHLGNDEIHIIWSEHWRDYRRDIIPTEFGDVLIVIYPVPSFPEYYRIDILRKPDVPFFGPLYSGAIVHLSNLAGLVRATAINASRAQRLNVPYYQNFFEERARCLESIVNQQDLKTFEDFAATSYSPAQLGLLTSRPVSSMSNTAVSGADTQSLSSIQSGQVTLEPTPSPRTRNLNRPVSTGTAHLEARPSPLRTNVRPVSAVSPPTPQ